MSTHDIKSHMASRRAWPHITNDILSHTTSHRTRHPDNRSIQLSMHPYWCHFPQTTCRLRPNTSITWIPRFLSHSTFQHIHVESKVLPNYTRSAHQCRFGFVNSMSSPARELLLQSLHVKFGSKVYYNLLMSSPISKLLIFVDNVVSSVIAAHMTFSI